MTPNGMDFSFCRQYVQVKTGEDLPREGVDAAVDEVLANYRTELGLSDKEAEQLEHLQVSYPACLGHPPGSPQGHSPGSPQGGLKSSVCHIVCTPWGNR